MNTRKATLCLFLTLSLSVQAQEKSELRITSPDGRQEICFFQSIKESGAKQVQYTLSYDGKEILKPSQAGLDLDNMVWEKATGLRKLPQPECWMDGMETDSVSYGAYDETWHPLYGERSTIHNAYRCGTMYLSRKDGSNYRLNIEVRAYNEGVAFRYYFPEHPQAIFHKVVKDLTEYTFADDKAEAWCEDWAQDFFAKRNINEIERPVERALTIELTDNRWVAITDADVDDWCLTKFISSKKRRNTLESVMYSPVDIVTYYATPWKVILTAETPGKLLENNDIIQNLNPPCEIADAAEWIKPGKIMRETTITTEGAMTTIDFCAAHHISYMLFDWKWYMPCTSHDGDATKVVDAIDMPRVVNYGKEKGVGIWLYVNQHALMKQAKELFPLLHEWGIAGIKLGFVQYASHRWATWVHDLVRLAAENHLQVNIHDEFRPSGFSRTYPNLLTQEGICGNEEFPDATHDVTLPFTRMINGAADYTICYYDTRLKNTHGHQLAASLIYYSPLLTIFWYDRPSFYNGEPEIEWFENLETTFDESRVLAGYPGKHIVMARRKGSVWFAAAMTNNDGSTENIPLSFLDSDKTYLAQIYTDGGDKIKTATQIKCSYFTVKSSQTLHFQLKPSGGAAIRFIPIGEKEKKQYRSYKEQIL